MKKFLMIVSIAAVLTGCCVEEPDPKSRREVFENCLKISAEARKSTGNYMTNDDEDFDEVVKECGIQSYNLSNMVCK